MSGVETDLTDAAARLRAEFDQSFGRPAVVNARDTIDLIALQAAGERLAIKLRDIAGLRADLKITPCPSPFAEFRGVAGMRASLVPVYDLSQLLGGTRSSGRWLVLAASMPVAFAFDEFRGHFRVPANGIAGSGGQARQHVHEIARNDQDAWPVIDIPSLVAAIGTRVATLISRKEQ